MAYKNLNQTLTAKNIKLVAVSKTKPESAILDLYQQGHRLFGENRVQELVRKQEQLPQDIQWHFIGHLQTNKVKYIAPFIQLIHAVDSVKVLKEINKQAALNDRTINILLQIKIAEEENKYGFEAKDVKEFLETDWAKVYANIRITGLMGMGTFSNDEHKIRNEFQELKGIFQELKQRYFAADDAFKELSMGMSGDYQIAMEEGTTMVRIGSLLFGHR